MRLIRDPATVFFIDHLLPAAERRNERGASLFSQPGSKSSSCFSVPRRTSSKGALEALKDDVSGVFELLERVWAQDGDADLTELIPELRKLVDEILASGEDGDESQGPSPQAYVLF